jgi:AraC family transcriptional regulator, regulatory protein of adaptative response / methylated-DNA-[protein]-cysteine methyltransferase
MTNPMTKIAEKAAKYIEACISADQEGPVKLSDIASHCGLSPWHLQRQFKAILGVSPREYGDALREKLLRIRLKQGSNVASAIYESGFGSSSRVYERASRRLGMTPASYAKGGKGAEISYTIASCPLGIILVAATKRGLCRVQLGDKEEPLIQSLISEFPHAETIQRHDKDLKPYLTELLRRIRGQTPHADIALDIRATAFQQKVWTALMTIPEGTTLSYRALAKKIGTPGAARAVGSACGANPVAIAIPCHRVIREDGSLGGYAWGLARKSQLLATERGGK